MLNSFKRWVDRNQGLHDAADTADVDMVPPVGWEPVEDFDEADRMEEED